VDKVFMGLLGLIVVIALCVAAFAGGIYLSIFYTQTFGVIAVTLIFSTVIGLFVYLRKH